MYIYDDNDFGRYDAPFWVPLFVQPLPHLQDKTFGQLAHIFFPNMKYALRFSSRTLKERQYVRDCPTVYLSEHNVVERGDTATLRKLAFEVMDEYHPAKRYPSRSFADLEAYPRFLVDRINIPPYAYLLECSLDAFARPERDPTRPQIHVAADNAEYKVMTTFQPLRSVAVMTLDGDTSLRIDLLTNAPLEEMNNTNLDKVKTTLQRRVLHIFWLLRTAIEEEKAPARSARLTMTLDLDMSNDSVPQGYPDTERIKIWMDEVSRAD
jgi:hypothetical protein